MIDLAAHDEESLAAELPSRGRRRASVATPATTGAGSTRTTGGAMKTGGARGLCAAPRTVDAAASGSMPGQPLARVLEFRGRSTSRSTATSSTSATPSGKQACGACAERGRRRRARALARRRGDGLRRGAPRGVGKVAEGRAGRTRVEGLRVGDSRLHRAALEPVLSGEPHKKVGEWNGVPGTCRGVVRRWNRVPVTCRGVVGRWNRVPGTCRGVVRRWNCDRRKVEPCRRKVEPCLPEGGTESLEDGTG